MSEIRVLRKPDNYTSEEYEAEWGCGVEQRTPHASVDLHVTTAKPLGSLSPSEAKAVIEEVRFMLFQLRDLYEEFR